MPKLSQIRLSALCSWKTLKKLHRVLLLTSPQRQLNKSAMRRFLEMRTKKKERNISERGGGEGEKKSEGERERGKHGTAWSVHTHTHRMQEGATTTFSLSFLLALNATLMEKQNRVESLQWWWHSPTKSRTCTRASTVQHSPVQAAEQSRAVTHTSPAAVFQSVYAKICQPCNKFGKNETKVKANFFTMKNTVKVIKKTFLTNCLVYYTVKTNSKERFMKWNIKIIIERSSVSHETLMR